MPLICNKKNENKIEENQLIILKKKYCSTLVADKNKPVTSFSIHIILKEEAWIDSCALWLCISSKLGGNGLMTYFIMKIHISA